MLSKKTEAALNAQLNAELYSAYLYLSMAAQFDALHLEGFAHWMRAQAKEEQTHAMKFYDHVVARQGRVTLTAIAAPPTEWASPLAAFEFTLKHEQKVTAMIHDLVALATEEEDPATGIFLQWFVREQVEEEESADEVLQMIKKNGDDVSGLTTLDRVLAQRA
jgi:ferritin